MNNKPFDDTGVLPGFAFSEENKYGTRDVRVHPVHAGRFDEEDRRRRAHEEEIKAAFDRSRPFWRW